MQEPQETRVRSLHKEDPLEEGMATHSGILAWRIPWTEEPGQATVHRVTKSQTPIKWLSMHSYSTGNSAQCYVKSWMGESLGEKGSMYIYGWFLCYLPENITTLLISFACVFQLFSCICLFVMPRTLARQDSLSMEFSRQEYWSGLTFPSPQDLANPGI